MGRFSSLLGNSPRPDRRPSSRLPLHRLVLADPAAFRRWLLVVALAAITAASINHLVSKAAEARHRWGDTRTVLVTRHNVEPGQKLADVVSSAQWPVGLIPKGAITRLPADARSLVALAVGMPLTDAALAGNGPGLVGRTRVALPAGAARLPLTQGEQVDVWATVDPSLAGGELTTRRIAVAAVVTSVSPTTVVVAVKPREVPGVAEAAALATVTLAATG